MGAGLARYPAVLLPLLLCAAVLVACGGGAGAPFEPTAVWQDGEQCVYDVTASDGVVTGRDTMTWSKRGASWVLSEERAGSRTVKREIVLDERLRPLKVTTTRGKARTEASYGDEQIEVKVTDAEGKTTDKVMARPADGIDNDQTLMTQRGLPLSAGYTTGYDNVSVAAGMALPTTVVVEGDETVTVPAGAFDSWRVAMRVAGSEHHAWYAKQAPHLLVRYENPKGGTSLQLRSWRQAEGAPLNGSAEEPAMRPAGSVPMSWLRVVVSLLVQVPLMVLLPLLLGFALARKLKVSWKLWFVGALTFVASQVVHLPLNWAIGLLGTPRGAGLLPLPWMALVAGLSAGVCEEVARYVALRFALRRIEHDWKEALQFGAGHGGIEAMIIGTLALLSLGTMVLIHYSPSALGLKGDVLVQTQEAADQFWLSPTYMTAVGAVERVFAMMAHIGMTVLVMRAVARRNIGYLFAAIGAHTVLDAFAVWAVARLGIAWTEVGVAVVGLALLGLTFALRDRAEPVAVG